MKDGLPQAVYACINNMWQQASTYSLFCSSLSIVWDNDEFDVFFLFSTNAFSAKSLEVICSLLRTQLWLSERHKRNKMIIFVEPIIITAQKRSFLCSWKTSCFTFLQRNQIRSLCHTQLSSQVTTFVTNHSFCHKTLSFTFSFPGFLFWKKS